MRANKPRRPEGHGPQALFAQSVWDLLWGGGLDFIDSPTVKFSRTTRGISAKAAGDSSSRLGVSLYRLKSVQGDYVTAKAWDGTSAGEAPSDASPDVYIAKAHKLRHSIDTETIEAVDYFYTYSADTPDLRNRYRSAYSDEAHATLVERCVVTPEWLLNDLIWAVPAPTGVYRTPASDGPPATPAADPVTLLMLFDGRAWAVHA